MSRHALTWLAVFAVITLMFLRLPQMAATQDAVVNTYSALVEVDALAKQQYVEPIEGDRLVEGAIRGMMRQLDPYSGYIAPHELATFERRSRGGYVGVGIVIGMVGDRPAVIAPIEGSPAAHAGIHPGDTILSIDGTDVTPRSVFDIEEMLVGQPHTTVRMRVLHEGESEPHAVVLNREIVHVVSVRGIGRTESGEPEFIVDATRRIGYIRVSNFHHATAREFDRALASIRARRAAALVLDLRFNPGGIMQEAISMADRFVADGLIVATVTRRQAVAEYRATAKNTLADLPVVVLVNGASASSAEIVAGALQARGRVVVVGSRSFGKGSVQHLIHLTAQKAAVKLTTAYYRLPDGRFIHRTARNAGTNDWGVIPDVVVPLTDDQERAIREARHELDLAFLSEEQDEAEDGTDVLDSAAPPSGPQKLPIDPQLAKALEILARQIYKPAGRK